MWSTGVCWHAGFLCQPATECLLIGILQVPDCCVLMASIHCSPMVYELRERFSSASQNAVDFTLPWPWCSLLASSPAMKCEFFTTQTSEAALVEWQQITLPTKGSYKPSILQERGYWLYIRMCWSLCLIPGLWDNSECVPQCATPWPSCCYAQANSQRKWSFPTAVHIAI